LTADVFLSFTVLTNRISRGYKDFGPIVRLWFGLFPFFVVFDPEHLQTILSSQKHTEKSFFYKLLHNFLGKGLITSSGEKWLTHRKLLQPTFHLNILEKFIGTFSASAQSLNEALRDKDEINITTFINDCVLDILNGEIKLKNFLKYTN
jgi:cytochrome P450 family 4